MSRVQTSLTIGLEALRHRIDLHKVYLKFPEKDAKDPLAESPPGTLSFIHQTHALFSGELSSRLFRFTTTDLPVPEDYKNLHKTSLKPKEIETFWKRLNQSTLDNGLQDKSFVYFIDEPKKADLQQIAKNLKQIRQWAPDLHFLVTTPYENTLEDSINIWCINLIQWDRPTEKSPAVYKQRQELKKEQLWFYVGCNSHGCEGAEAIENPDLVMDRPSSYIRVFPWMAIRYGAEGILYYDSVYGYSHGSPMSPWKDAFSFTGYGEGNLFYPCSPLIAGCKSQQVFASTRLKILRDGLEDVQILKMLEEKGTAVNSTVTHLIPGVRNFPTKTAAYEELKRWALSQLENKKTTDEKK